MPSTLEETLKKVEAKNFAEFIKTTDSFDLLAELVVFRGQAKKGNLIPSIARPNPKADTTEHEKLVLEQLQLLGASYLNGF